MEVHNGDDRFQSNFICLHGLEWGLTFFSLGGYATSHQLHDNWIIFSKIALCVSGMTESYQLGADISDSWHDTLDLSSQLKIYLGQSCGLICNIFWVRAKTMLLIEAWSLILQCHEFILYELLVVIMIDFCSINFLLASTVLSLPQYLWRHLPHPTPQHIILVVKIQWWRDGPSLSLSWPTMHCVWPTCLCFPVGQNIHTAMLLNFTWTFRGVQK